MRLLVLATLCSLVVQTKQTKWQEIGKTGIGNPVLVDPKSVKKDTAGIITATLRVAFVKPVATPNGPITSSRTVAMFDCKKQVVAVKENTYYHDEKANRIYQHSKPGLPGYAKPFQGALPEVAMNYLCKK